MNDNSNQVLNGLSKLVNKDNIKSDINIEEIEKNLINKGILPGHEPDTIFVKELEKIPPVEEFKPKFGNDDKTEELEMDQDDEVEEEATIPTYKNDIYGSYKPEQSEPSMYNNLSPRNQNQQSHQQTQQQTQQPQLSKLFENDNSEPEESFMSEMQGGRTNDEEKHNKIRYAMSNMGINPHSSFLEREKKEDAKSAMLEEIDFLRDELLSCHYSIERIPHVTQKSSYEEIESILRLLRHKSDRIKYCEFAESFLMLGAYGLEEIFNGKNNWFGYKPDLTGWSNHVDIKLRRMRHDTSQLVSQAMHDYNIGPGARILLELVPNAIIYSRQKKQTYSEPKINEDENLNSSFSRLRDLKL
jgi:hypothetical protein